MTNNTQKTQILGYGENSACMADLARSSGLTSVQRATDAHARHAPFVIDAMVAAGRTPAGAEQLFAFALGLTWVERDTPEVLFQSAETRVGHGLAPVLFGDSLPGVVAKIASTEQLNDLNAGALLEVIAAVTIAVMADKPGTNLTTESLTVEGLAATLASNASAPGSPLAAPTQAAQAGPAQVAATWRGDSEDPASGAAAAAGTSTIDLKYLDDEEKSNKGLLVGGAIGLVALLGVGFVVFGGGSGDSADDASDAATIDSLATESAPVIQTEDAEPTEPVPDEIVPAVDTTLPAVDTTVPVEEVAETTVPAEEAPDESDLEPVSVAPLDKVSLSVPMIDIVTPSRDADGVLNFNFDTETGEVCYSVESANIAGPYRSHIHVGALGDKGGIVVDLGLLESGEIGCVENLPVDTNDILANPENHYAELHDVSEEWTIRGQLSETVEREIVALSIPMVNDEGVSPDASGMLNFEFNTVTGEVCYSVESMNIEGPYRSHIHVGDAGVKGGIVVDLGALDSGDVGCVENLPIDTNAILAGKSGHYAELHDISEEFTIRGQLSEATSADDEPEVENQVDADGGGASIVLFGGTVFLQGAVPDQATADEMFESLTGIDAGTPVVNELTVEADAPLPSGRVVIADAVFFDSASADVNDLDDATLAAITALALSRDDWILTVVGHTDGEGSDVANLELSLRRATALRELLANAGVPEENLRIRGAGSTAPIGDNNTAEGRAQNRRIEFEFTPQA